MFTEFEYIRAPYEVVKTVGFDLESPSESGPTSFTMRIDVVQFFDAGDLAPMIWQVTPGYGDALLLHTAPGASPIRGKTPEEVIRAVMKSFQPPAPQTPEEAPAD